MILKFSAFKIHLLFFIFLLKYLKNEKRVVMKNKYKSIFISDIHLGSYPCKADMLLSFLKENECENLFLIGDIIDGWRLQSKFYWPQKHTDVLRKFLNLSHKNVNIIWITGNHDEFLREFSGLNLKFGNITICDEY